MKGLIFNIQRFSVHDGPGIRTTVFLKGCPLSCAWCHNPESISSHRQLVLHESRCIRCGDCMVLCKNNAIHKEDGKFVTAREVCLQCGDCIEACYAEGREITGREMTSAEVMQEIEKDIVFFDQSGGGATFSGGEPLLQHEFLLSLLETCKEKSIHTTVDTSGFVSPDILERISRFVDLFLFDLKTLDDKTHKEFTGISNRLIVENLQRLAQWHKHLIVRIPIVPGINDDVRHIRRAGSFLASLGTISEIHVLPYHKTGVEKYHRLGLEYRMHDIAPPSAERINEIVDELRDHHLTVSVGG